MNRAETLEAAKKCVCGDREQDYGNPEDNFALIAALWSAYLGIDISPLDVPNMLIHVKQARSKSGHAKDDNWIDIAGYAACGCEIQGN